MRTVDGTDTGWVTIARYENGSGYRRPWSVPGCASVPHRTFFLWMTPAH